MGQKKILVQIDKFKTQLNEIDHVKLRQVSLNLKGATELKDGTKQKIPKLEANKNEIEEKLKQTTSEHNACKNAIDELAQKRDSLRRHLIDSQKQNGELVAQYAKKIKQFEQEQNSANDMNALVEVE